MRPTNLIRRCVAAAVAAALAFGPLGQAMAQTVAGAAPAAITLPGAAGAAAASSGVGLVQLRLEGAPLSAQGPTLQSLPAMGAMTPALAPIQGLSPVSLPLPEESRPAAPPIRVEGAQRPGARTTPAPAAAVLPVRASSQASSPPARTAVAPGLRAAAKTAPGGMSGAEAAGRGAAASTPEGPSAMLQRLGEEIVSLPAPSMEDLRRALDEAFSGSRGPSAQETDPAAAKAALLLGDEGRGGAWRLAPSDRLSAEARPEEVPAPAGQAGMEAVSRLVWATVAAGALDAALRTVFSGIAAGPDSAVFKICEGALLFWSGVGSITLHEVGHARVADSVGDVTARMAGQLSPNPLKFTGPLGATLSMMSAMLGFPLAAFGTNMQQSLAAPENQKALAKVAAAGPMVNLALAGLIAGIIAGVRFAAPGAARTPWVGGILRALFRTGSVNVMLGVSNLIPLGPLDGQKVLMGFVPERYHARVQKATLYLGLALMALYALYGLGTHSYTAVTQHGAGTPLAHTGNALVMSVFANAGLLWLLALFPWLKGAAAGALNRYRDWEALKAGGLPLTAVVVSIKGRAPHAELERMPLVVPWSGDAAGRAALAHREADISGLDELAATPEEGRRVLLASDGRALPVDETLMKDLRRGALLLLKVKDSPEFIAVPSEALGGDAEVLALGETSAAAAILDGDERGRRLLSPEEKAVVVRVSESLKMPVYELEYEPGAARPGDAFLARTELGDAFFIRASLLAEIAALPGAEREKRVAGLVEELRRRLP